MIYYTWNYARKLVRLQKEDSKENTNEDDASQYESRILQNLSETHNRIRHQVHISICIVNIIN